MVQLFTLAVPIALLWTAVTGHVTAGSLLVGYLVGVVTLLVLHLLGVRARAAPTPRQVVALLQYSGWLFWSALVSSIQVARLILRPRIELRTGIVALPTGDDSRDQRLAALSAHGINMSPGQLVIDFDDAGRLYIHCLDIESARPRLEAEQARRTRLLRAVLGENAHG